MKKCGIAFLLSLLFHGLIAAGIVFYIEYSPAPDELAQLDLTSVDLSFAETPDETAAAVPASVPMPPTPPPKPSEPQPELPPEDLRATDPTMPQPDTTDLPKPELEVWRFGSLEVWSVSEGQGETVSEKLRNDRLLEESKAETFNSSLLALNSSSVAPRQAKVDAPPKPRRNIRPDYPKESRQRGEQGNVTLEIDVNAEGSVDDVRVAASSGFPLLDEAAVKAARAARFTPAKAGGRAVFSTARLTLSFKLK